MPATYTSSLRLTKPAVGDTNWGTTVNSGFTDLTDSAIAGYTTVSMPSNADYTLTSVNGAADEARSMMLNITSAVSLTTTRNVICPSVSKLYSIKNATTGGQSIVLKTSGGSGVTIPNGSTMILACNGTDVVVALDYISFSNLAYTGTLTGDTGVVNLGSGQFYKDASGNVGIGTSSPGARLHVAVSGTGSGLGDVISETVGANGNAGYAFRTAGVTRWSINVGGTDGSNALRFYDANASAERMRLDSSGNLGIGTASPGAKLQVGDAGSAAPVKILIRSASADTYLQSTSTGAEVGTPNGVPLLFKTNDTDRARITSGGDLLVGTTDTLSSGRMRVSQSGGASQGVVDFNHAAASGTRYLAVFYVQGVEKGSITSDGSAVAYNTSSDRRLKENIAPAADAGAVLDAIEVVQHDWKAGGHTRYGLIAQDLNAVAPEAVSAGDDGDEIERTWSVDYSKLVPMLIKEIQSLRARVAALEAA